MWLKFLFASLAIIDLFLFFLIFLAFPVVSLAFAFLHVSVACGVSPRGFHRVDLGDHVNSCKAYLCLVHGKVENRLQCVVNRYAELGGTEGRGGCRWMPNCAGQPYQHLYTISTLFYTYTCYLSTVPAIMCTREARRLWSSSWSAVRAIDGGYCYRLRYRLHSSKMPHFQHL